MASLLKMGYKEYDEDLVQDVLEPRDADVCLQILVLEETHLDEWYWCLDIRRRCEEIN